MEFPGFYCWTQSLFQFRCISVGLGSSSASKDGSKGRYSLRGVLESKKLVFIGKEESQLMYVTTGKTVLRVLSMANQELPHKEAIDYLIHPHSLRVGALISVRNIHFLNPKFSWTEMLILGSCFKTSIIVECFSPLETGCHKVSQSQSLLGKFIDSLAFSARLWVLLVVSCFRKRKDWFQVFARSHLPSSVFQYRYGVFMEFCKHDSCGCGTEPNYDQLKLVAPISNLVHHCEAMWMKNQLEGDCETMVNNNEFSQLSCGGRSHGLPITRILPSEAIGVILLGSFKALPRLDPLSAQNIFVVANSDVFAFRLTNCTLTQLPSCADYISPSGRLQLIDATGCFDVVIPDLPSDCNSNSIYEVNDYSLVMEGMPDHLDHFGLVEMEPFSCRSIFESSPLDNLKELEDGRFHMLHVTHKFPVLQKFQKDQVVSDGLSMLVEAVVLPWDLFLSGKNPTKVSKDQKREPMELYNSRNYHEYVSFKRCKIDHASSRLLSSGLTDKSSVAGMGSCGHLSDCSSANKQYPVEIPCLACCRSGRLVSSGSLYCTEAALKFGAGCKLGALKVLLEFKSESFFKYQLLQIGGYYITKHQNKDPFCNHRDFDYVRGGKFLITSGTTIWSLSFSYDEIFHYTDPSFDPALVTCPLHNSQQTELLLQRSTDNCHEMCSDIHLHLPADLKNELEVDFTVLEKRSDQDSSKTGRVSLQGQVLAVHNLNHTSLDARLSNENYGDVRQLRLSRGVTWSTCIHVLMDHHIVSIFGGLSEHAYPTGFGPGVVADFSSNSRTGGKLRSYAVLYKQIVAVHFLVLEKNRKSQPKVPCRLSVDIPLASFVLDFQFSPRFALNDV
ncbi:CST complex subunit CTC1 [Vitis vinifera]|uniref:CST complex subunit CTC1 n=1 Tax=Vitis vinifera TaxID=29760 RepID=A0A438ESA5_VITVI|nr:CST complex subunit CTC1 [Vitis vinifera]